MCARWRRPGAPIVRAGAPRDLERPARAVERGRDRRDRLDRALERRAVVGRGTHVEHQQHRGAPPGLVLAHHQVAAARRRPPVHVAEVVAGRVLAQRHEVAAGLDPRAHRGVVAVEVETADVGRRRRSRGPAGTRSPARCRARAGSTTTSPNGSVSVARSGPISKRPRRSVGKRYAARASSPGASGASRNRAARRPWSNASATAIVGPRRVAVHDEVDATLDADLQQLLQRPAGDERGVPDPHPDVRPDEQQHRCDREHRELHEPEQPGADVEADGGSDERPSATGQHRGSAASAGAVSRERARCRGSPPGRRPG